MPKRPASPNAMNSNNALQKTPIFLILLGLSAILLLTVPVMYSQLETISRDDDLMQLGSSGGDGMRQDEALRRFRKQQKKKRRREKRNHNMDIPVGMSMGGGGGDNPKFLQNIRDFAKWKHQEAQRRKQRGLLSSREEFEANGGYGNDNLKDLKEHVRQTLRVPDRPSPPDVPYDIYNCPAHPPPKYPYAWNALKVLGHWNPDDTELPPTIHQSLCVFDWETDQEKAYTYREKQVPFVMQNVPEIMKT
eukprot:Sro980_g227340.2  (247) ;mRNA; f:3081-3821